MRLLLSRTAAPTRGDILETDGSGRCPGMAHPAAPILNLAEDVGRYFVAGQALEALDELGWLQSRGDGLDDRFAGQFQNRRAGAGGSFCSLAERGKLGGRRRV